MRCIAPIIPVWAEKIEVQRIRSRLIVRGMGRDSYPVNPFKSEVAIRALSQNPKQPIHLEFADACSIVQLLNFVARYGPVHGRLEAKNRPNPNKEKIEKPRKEDLVVREDLNALIREQQLFRAAVHLLSELKKKRQDRFRIADLVSNIRQLYPTDSTELRKSKCRMAFLGFALRMAEPTTVEIAKEDLSRRPRAILERLRYESILQGLKRTDEGLERQRSKAAAIQHDAVVGGHGVLCEIFNRFPLRLFPCSDGAIELPSYDREGVLPILYFLLRRDYRDRHFLIKVCKVCAITFKPERGDPDCCGRKCYKQLNDHDRYLRKKRLPNVA